MADAFTGNLGHASDRAPSYLQAIAADVATCPSIDYRALVPELFERC